MAPKPDPTPGPLPQRLAILPTRPQSHRNCALGTVLSPPGCDVLPPSAGSPSCSDSPATSQRSGPHKAHIQGPLCAWHWVLCFTSTQVGGSFSPFTDAVMSLGWGLRNPWGAGCWRLSALLNGRDLCRYAQCCHGSPAITEHL